MPLLHTGGLELEQLLDQAKRENKQLMFEIIEQEDEKSLLEHAQLNKRFRGHLNFFMLKRKSAVARELGIRDRSTRFLLLSPDKQMRLAVQTFDVLLVENAVSIYLSTVNIRQQISFLTQSGHLSRKQAEQSIAAYYARHDKTKSPESAPQYYLNIYTLQQRYFPDFQKSYMKNWDTIQVVGMYSDQK